jgi:hypothetical protein
VDDSYGFRYLVLTSPWLRHLITNFLYQHEQRYQLLKNISSTVLAWLQLERIVTKYKNARHTKEKHSLLETLQIALNHCFLKIKVHGSLKIIMSYKEKAQHQKQSNFFLHTISSQLHFDWYMNNLCSNWFRGGEINLVYIKAQACAKDGRQVNDVSGALGMMRDP